MPEALASLNRVASTWSNLTAKSKRGGQRSVTRLRGYGEPTLSHNAPLNPTIAETTRPKCNFTTLYQTSFLVALLATDCTLYDANNAYGK